MIDRNELRRFFPRGNCAWLEALEIIGPDLARRHGVTTIERWRQLMTQVAAETDGLALPQMRENMRYRAPRILEVFSYRVRLAQRSDPRWRGQSLEQIAAALAASPELLAETVYGGRKELGNIRPGDGARHIGRGPLQTTGREWYDKLGRAIGVDLIANPEMLEEPYVGWKAAFAEWEMLGCNQLADRCSIDLTSRRVNGGTNGIERRRAEYHRAGTILLRAPVPSHRDTDSVMPPPVLTGWTADAAPDADDAAADVTPRHAGAVPQMATAASLAAGGSRSMSWLLRLRAWLIGAWASISAFLGLDSLGGARNAMQELKGIIHDNSTILVVLALAMATGVILLVQHYLVAAARDGRYEPGKGAADA